MSLTEMKYRFLACFHCEQMFFNKTKNKLFYVLSRNSIFFKTSNNYVQHHNL
jgi:hypothetical protein